MSNITKLSNDLKSTINKEETLNEIIKVTQNHYLGYFLSNLVLEYMTYHEYISEGQNRKILEEDSELKKVVHYIKKSLFDTQNWLNPSSRSVSHKITTLIKYRNVLSDHVAAIAGYDDQLKMHDYVLKRRNTEIKKHPAARISDEDFAGMLVQHIFEYEDTISIVDRIKQTYCQLPVRMSRMKLHEWVESALVGMKGITVGDLDNYITYLKETYNPEDIACYGDVLGGVHEALGEFEVLYTDIVNNEKIQHLEMTMTAIKSTLNACVSLYSYTVSVINNMIGVLSVLNEQSIKANDEAIARFIRIMKYIESRKDELILIDEVLVRELDEIAIDFDEQRMNNGKMDALVDEAKQGCVDEIIKYKLDKSFDRLTSLYILQSSSYFAPLSLEAQATTPVDEKILIKKKNELLEYMDLATENDSRIGKRARIANLLGVINVIHKSPQEVHRYILNTLTQCRDEREKIGCKIILNEWMHESNGFLD